MVAKRVLRVPVEVLPVNERNGALDVGLGGHGAGKNNPAGALRRVRRGPIEDYHRRAARRRSICDRDGFSRCAAVALQSCDESVYSPRSMPAALSRSSDSDPQSFGADEAPSRSLSAPTSERPPHPSRFSGKTSSRRNRCPSSTASSCNKREGTPMADEKPPPPPPPYQEHSR